MNRKDFITKYKLNGTEKEKSVIDELIVYEMLNLNDFISRMITDTDIANISRSSLRSIQRYSIATDERGKFLYKALKNESIRVMVKDIELLSSEND